MIFKDRSESGKLLAEKVSGAEIVVALPRGGVVVGYEIASALDLPLEVVCPRKIGAPGNPEYAIGAVTEGGAVHLERAAGYNKQDIEQIISEELLEAQRRATLYRAGRPRYSLKGKAVLIVDDGIATGSTMLAAIESVRQQGAKSITVAVPVAPLEASSRLGVDLIALAQPEPFYAVGQFYRHFDQTTDEEVIALLARCSDGRNEDSKPGNGERL